MEALRGMKGPYVVPLYDVRCTTKRPQVRSFLEGVFMRDWGEEPHAQPLEEQAEL